MEIIDIPMIDKVNAIGGSIIVVLTYLLGDHWVLFAAFLFLNLIDYVTGVIKSKIHNNESSSAGLRGIIKKFSYWVMITLAFVMGGVLNEMGEAIGVDLSLFTPLIGWYTLASLALNEFRSILENLTESGIAVPPVLLKGLGIMSDKIAGLADQLFDGTIDLDGDGGSHEYHAEIDTPADELRERGTVTLRIHTTDE